jgi:hypothetical protein
VWSSVRSQERWQAASASLNFFIAINALARPSQAGASCESIAIALSKLSSASPNRSRSCSIPPRFIQVMVWSGAIASTRSKSAMASSARSKSLNAAPRLAMARTWLGFTVSTLSQHAIASVNLPSSCSAWPLLTNASTCRGSIAIAVS